MYLITLFRIDSEIRIQDSVAQEIDYRVLREFDNFDEAIVYLRAIKNSVMMYNFPFAMIQQMEQHTTWRVLEQKLYMLDEINGHYSALDDLSILTITTRKKLHNFNERVELIIS